MVSAQEEKRKIPRITKAEIVRTIPTLTKKLGKIKKFSNLSATETQTLRKVVWGYHQLQKTEQKVVQQNKNSEWKQEHTVAAAAGGIVLAAGTAATIAVAGISAPIIGSGLIAAGAGVAIGAVIYNMRKEEMA